MRLLICMLLLCLYCLPGFAQQTDSTANDERDQGVIIPPDNSEPLKLGVKLGIGYSRMTGNEMKNPGGSIGINGGVYLRYRFKSNFALQAEAGASFRGGSFSNGPGEYSALKTYYLDGATLGMLPLDKKATSYAVAGVQYSYLINSVLYVSDPPSPYPIAPALLKSDVMAVAGAQFYTPFVGFQVLAKYGLLDINNGLLGANTKPVNTGKDIHNLSVEINFLF